MDISEFLNSTGGIAVKGALAAAFLDFAFGVFAAARDGSFALDAVAAFVRKHILGRVAPVSVLAYVGYTTGDLAMITAAGGALTAYAFETTASIYSSIADIRHPQGNSAATTAEAPNPIPTD